MVLGVVDKADTIVLDNNEKLDSWAVVLNGYVEHTHTNGSIKIHNVGDQWVVLCLHALSFFMLMMFLIFLFVKFWRWSHTGAVISRGSHAYEMRWLSVRFDQTERLLRDFEQKQGEHNEMHGKWGFGNGHRIQNHRRRTWWRYCFESRSYPFDHAHRFCYGQLNGTWFQTGPIENANNGL